MDIGGIFAERIPDIIGKVEIFADESGVEILIESQHIMQYQYLTVASISCTDPDRRDLQHLRDICRKGCGDLL